MRRCVPLLLIAALLLAGCNQPGAAALPAAPQAPDATVVAAAVVEEAAADTPTPPPAPTEPPPTIALDTAEVERQLAGVEADTTELRGLRAKADVPEHFMSPAEMKARLVEQTVRTRPSTYRAIVMTPA